MTPHRSLDPPSLHLSASRHNDKTVPHPSLRKRGRRMRGEEREGGGAGEDRRCLTAAARKSGADS